MAIRRKTFLKGLAIGTLSLPLTIRGCMGQNVAQRNGGPNVITNRKYRWKMVTTWPPAFPVLGEAAQLFADTVARMSGGRIEIRVYGGGELVPALECFDAVRTGAAEVASGAAYYWAGKIPAAQFFASVPFGMNAQQLNAWVMSGGGQQLWEELYADYNLVPTLGGNTGVQMGGWFNREINSIEDLKGLKMRIPGLGGKVLERAGGSPVLLAGGEIYVGLDRGVIDATEWLGPFHDTLMGFQEIAKYYYSPGWHEPGTALEYLFNKKKIEALPADLQTILRTAAHFINSWTLSEFESRNTRAFDELVRQGVAVRRYPETVLQELRRLTDEVISQLIERNLESRKVYASYQAFRSKAIQYANISEKRYYEQLM